MLFKVGLLYLDKAQLKHVYVIIRDSLTLSAAA